MSEKHPHVVGSIRPVGVASLLAAELREQVLRGELSDGSSLPGERSLAEQSGLGRSSVREALRMLEAEGLISVRSGRAGGITVHRPGAATLSRSIGLLVRSGETPAELVEFREVLEPSYAGLAAARRTADDLAALQRCNEEMDERVRQIEGGQYQYLRDELIQINTRWHMAVAVATQNVFLTHMLTAIESILTSAVASEFNIHVYEDDSIWAVTLAAHRAVTGAIAKGDVDAAVRRMRRHVHGYAEFVEAARAENRANGTARKQIGRVVQHRGSNLAADD